MNPLVPRGITKSKEPHEVRPGQGGGGWIVWRPRSDPLIEGFAVFWGTEQECHAVKKALDTVHEISH